MELFYHCSVYHKKYHFKGLTTLLALTLLSNSPKAAGSSFCHGGASSTFQRFLDERVLPDRKMDSLRSCFEVCRTTFGCESINYRLNDGLCELNDKNHLTHPQYLENNNGYVYLAVLDDVKVQSSPVAVIKVIELRRVSSSSLLRLSLDCMYVN